VEAVTHEEVPRYIRSMDIAVAPYPELDRFYYSPLKVLEYMAAGRPVVASAIGQLNELIEPDRTGLLVTPGDADALTRAIAELAGDPDRREALGAAAADEVRRSHLWTHRAEQIVSFTGKAA
jgi:glycosyltransferase involved in cell wall biosynthesis